MSFVRDKFSKLRWHRRRAAVGSRRHGNGYGCIPTAPHANGREPNNSHVYGHENSLAIELNFVPRMGTPGVPLFPQKNQFSIRGVIMARLACPFWARQACPFWERKKRMFPRKFRNIEARIPVWPCETPVQFQTHTLGPILYFSYTRAKQFYILIYGPQVLATVHEHSEWVCSWLLRIDWYIAYVRQILCCQNMADVVTWRQMFQRTALAGRAPHLTNYHALRRRAAGNTNGMTLHQNSDRS